MATQTEVLAKQLVDICGETESDRIQATLWAALKKIGEKFENREVLKDGQISETELTITGSVEGKSIDHMLKGFLTVGHETNRRPSHPPYKQILEHILCKLNKSTRDAILRDLPQEFEENGKQWPENPELSKQIEDMIGRLKDVIGKQPVKGSVSWEGLVL